MRTCEEHEDVVIVYDEDNCPLCDAIEGNEHLEEEISELKEKRATASERNRELEQEIKKLEKQLANFLPKPS